MDEKKEGALESEVTELLDAGPAEATVDDRASEEAPEVGDVSPSNTPDAGDGDDRTLDQEGDEGALAAGLKNHKKWVLSGLGIVALGAMAVALCTQPLTPGRATGVSGSGPMGSVAGSAPVAIASLTADDVKAAIAKLSWEGEDVSIDVSTADVVVDGSDVWIRSTDSAADAAGSVSRGAKRSAAAAHALASSGADKVTWTVVDSDGKPMVSIEQDVQSAPTGGEWTDALEGSDGYVISDGTYEAMGGEASGVPQAGGEAPVDHEGNEIVTPPTGADTDDDSDTEAPTEDGEEGEGVSGAGTQNGGSTPSGGSTDSSASGGGSTSGATSSSSKPSGGSSSQGGASSSKPSGGSSSSQTTSPSKPAHQHSWQPVYRTEPVYETQQVWVPKQEIVRHTLWQCSACGATFGSDQAIDDHIWGTYGDATHPNGASAIDQSWDEVVDNGHYESQTVQTGTTQVLDHYACSCGATK